MKSILKLSIFSLLLLVTGCNVESLDSSEALNQTRNYDDDTCETAFGYSEGNCFLNDGFNRWGWVIGPLSESDDELTYDLYAGAGQCNLNNGALVGSITVSYLDGTVTVDYNALPGYGFTETHLYVGNDRYPEKRNGRPTVAPGQYGNQNEFSEAVGSDSYTIEDVEGEIYIIAHAVVCETMEETCDAYAGTIEPKESEVCRDENSQVFLIGVPNGDAVVPDGYEVLYLLTRRENLQIIGVSSEPNFIVNGSDVEYRIHTLVYDPNTLDVSNLLLTDATDIASQLIENGGDICGSLDTEGAQFKFIGECAIGG